MTAPRAKKPRLCIFGADGFIGTHLTETLAQTRLVKALVRKNVPAAYRNQSGVSVFRGSAGDRALLDRMIEPRDTIINLVGATSAEARFGKLLDSHVGVQRSLLDSCARAGVKKIIFASSVAIYGSVLRPAGEDDLPRPADDYALTKLFAEQMHEYYAGKYNIPLVILRLGSVYGTGQRKGVVYSFAQSIKNSGKIRIPKRTVYRDFVFIDDVIDAIIKAMRFAGKGTDRFNIASGQKISLARLARMAQKCVGRPISIARIGASSPDLDTAWADRRRAELALGWKPRVSLERGLRKTFSSYGLF